MAILFPVPEARAGGSVRPSPMPVRRQNAQGVSGRLRRRAPAEGSLDAPEHSGTLGLEMRLEMRQPSRP